MFLMHLTLNLVTICFHSDSRSPHSKCEIFYMKQISRIISKLRNIDLQYHLLKNTGRSSYSEETSGKTLEFIGTSGIGKTTLAKILANSVSSEVLYLNASDDNDVSRVEKPSLFSTKSSTTTMDYSKLPKGKYPKLQRDDW